MAKRRNLRGRHAVEGIVFVRTVSIKVSPELDEEESVLWSLVKQFLESTRLLRELVLDLPHVHWLRREKIELCDED